MTPRQKGIYEEIVDELERQLPHAWDRGDADLYDLDFKELAIAIDKKLHG